MGRKEKAGGVYFYNLCRRLELNRLEETEGINEGRVVWCGDFNAHHTLWGRDKTDSNGRAVAELLDEKNLVGINDGSSTRIDVSTGKESALHLTLVSSTLAPTCEWNVQHKGTMGSDHYPIYS